MTFKPIGYKMKVKSDVTILDALRKAGINIRSECGGKGICGKCKIIVSRTNAPAELTEVEMKHLSSREINSHYRLACQATFEQDVEITIPKESRVRMAKLQTVGLERPILPSPFVTKFHAKLKEPSLSDARADLERLLDALSPTMNIHELEINYRTFKKLPDVLRRAKWDVTAVVWRDRRIIAVEPKDTSSEMFGLAVDIGTSKLVGYLVKLMTGETISIGSVENPQIVHGEDIITRITFAMSSHSNLKTLQKLAIKGINEVLAEVCKKAGVDPNCVYEVTAVGNTAMHHFLLAIQPKYTAFSPYPPAVKSSVSLEAEELNLKVNPGGIITVLPNIAGFVGADAVGDLLATGIHESSETSLLMDIGTNTEIFVGNSKDILSCSCASGPVFEGAHIKHGIRAMTGAIESIRIKPSFEVEYETIGTEKPIGLTGSAMVDVVAEMWKRGIINSSGRFTTHLKTERLRTSNCGIEFIPVFADKTATGRDIVVTQKDISEVQLAKAAIYTGCSILMKSKNMKKEDLDRVLIAGAFGSNIDPENAKILGLVPDVPTKKIMFVGNTAVIGAKMALVSREARQTANKLSKEIRYIELAANSEFSKEFLDATFIPHKHVNRFPSARKHLKTTHKSL